MVFELFIGLRYLRIREGFISLITVLSVAGVAVGVMALIVVISVMAGFESDLKSRILGVESHIVITRPEVPFKDYPEILNEVRQIDGVESATAYIETQMMLRSADRMTGAVLRGIDLSDAHLGMPYVDRELLRKLNDPPAIDNIDRTPPGIILGKELAMSLGVVEGETLHLVTPTGVISPMGHLPYMKRFQVVGYFKSGIYDFDGSLSYVSMKEAQKMLRMGGAATGIEIRLKNIYRAENVAGMLSDRLGETYRVKDWMEMNRNLFFALKLEKTMMFVILALIILVAAFNIASMLIMMVMHKTKDIAILKAMGATRRSIAKIFVFKGMVIGLAGTLFGGSIGILLCVLLKYYEFVKLPELYYISTLPVELEPMTIILTIVSAFVICFLATLYPAHQAAGLDPIDAIRYG